MILFITIAVICLLLTYSSDLVKLMQISKLLSTFHVDSPQLQEELKYANAEYEQVRANPASGEYAQFVKLKRAEQKISDVEEKIRSERNITRLQTASVDLIGGYTLKAMLYLTLFIISIRNRYTPVMIFDDRFNFEPLEGLLSFPTGVHNAISVPVWVLSCNVSFRLISSLIKRKK